MNLEQKTRWSKDEMELIKANFQGEKGLELLYKIRNVFFQKDSLSSKTGTYTVMGDLKLEKEVIDIIRKMLIPTVDGEIPFSLQANYRNLLVGKEMDIRNFPLDMAVRQIKANDLSLKYIKQRIDVLGGGLDIDNITLESLALPKEKNDEERFIEMLAYLSLPSYMDAGLNELRNLANFKEETEEERKKRILKDSAK